MNSYDYGSTNERYKRGMKEKNKLEREKNETNRTEERKMKEI